MTAGALLRALVATLALALFLFWPVLMESARAAYSVPRLIETDLLVESVHCGRLGMQRGQQPLVGERVSSGVPYCAIEGLVEGTRASLNTAGSPHALPDQEGALQAMHPPGSRLRVLFDPEAPDLTVNAQTLGVFWWQADPAGSAWRTLGSVAFLALAPLIAQVVCYGVWRRRCLLPAAAGSRRFRLHARPTLPAPGLSLVGLGLGLMAARAAGILADSTLAGAVLVVLGLVALVGRCVEIRAPDESPVRVGWHLFGWAARLATVQAEPPLKWVLSGHFKRELVLSDQGSRWLYRHAPPDGVLTEETARQIAHRTHLPLQIRDAESG